MTPRLLARTRCAVASLVLVAAVLPALTGCDPRSMAYFLQPFEPVVPPPANSPALKGKKVVVLTHATSATQIDSMSLDRDLAREVVALLRKKIKKIEVVSPDKVFEWVEGHPNWTDPGEAAKAFEADIAIFLEVEQFSTQNPGDLNVMQGVAKVHIQAIELAHPTNNKGKALSDQPKEARIVYDQYQDTEFPVRGPIPYDSGVSRGAFRNKFLQIVASECSWHFVEHAPDDVIQDVKFNNK